MVGLGLKEQFAKNSAFAHWIKLVIYAAFVDAEKDMMRLENNCRIARPRARKIFSRRANEQKEIIKILQLEVNTSFVMCDIA